jgi:hypothetical protein
MNPQLQQPQLKKNGEIHCIVLALWIHTSVQSTTGLRVIGCCICEWHFRSFTVQPVHVRHKEPIRAYLKKYRDGFQNWVTDQASMKNPDNNENRKGIVRVRVCDECVLTSVPSKLRGCAVAQQLRCSAYTELLPRSWTFSIFIVNILIKHITKKCSAQSSSRSAKL